MTEAQVFEPVMFSPEPLPWINCEDLGELDAPISEDALYRDMILELIKKPDIKWRKTDLLQFSQTDAEDLPFEFEWLGYELEFRDKDKLRLKTDNIDMEYYERYKVVLPKESTDLEYARNIGAVMMSGILLENGKFGLERIKCTCIISIDGKMPTNDSIDKYRIISKISGGYKRPEE